MAKSEEGGRKKKSRRKKEEEEEAEAAAEAVYKKYAKRRAELERMVAQGTLGEKEKDKMLDALTAEAGNKAVAALEGKGKKKTKEEEVKKKKKKRGARKVSGPESGSSSDESEDDDDDDDEEEEEEEEEEEDESDQSSSSEEDDSDQEEEEEEEEEEDEDDDKDEAMEVDEEEEEEGKKKGRKRKKSSTIVVAATSSAAKKGRKSKNRTISSSSDGGSPSGSDSDDDGGTDGEEEEKKKKKKKLSAKEKKKKKKTTSTKVKKKTSSSGAAAAALVKVTDTDGESDHPVQEIGTQDTSKRARNVCLRLSKLWYLENTTVEYSKGGEKNRFEAINFRKEPSKGSKSKVFNFNLGERLCSKLYKAFVSLQSKTYVEYMTYDEGLKMSSNKHGTYDMRRVCDHVYDKTVYKNDKEFSVLIRNVAFNSREIKGGDVRECLCIRKHKKTWKKNEKPYFEAHLPVKLLPKLVLAMQLYMSWRNIFYDKSMYVLPKTISSRPSAPLAITHQTSNEAVASYVKHHQQIPESTVGGGDGGGGGGGSETVTVVG